MQFYEIRHSLNEKIVGSYPQAEEAKHNCNVWDEPLFIKNFYFEKIEITPIVSNAILKNNSKLTDLISIPVMGFSNKLLISGKLKKIIEKYKESGIQYFQSGVYHKNRFFEDYWVMNIFEFNNEYIDFEKTEFSLRIRKKGGGTELKKININSTDELSEKIAFHKKKQEIVKAERVFIRTKINDNFFVLKNSIKYIVSENLKKEIEESGCTGIEFTPVEMTLNEWLFSEREKIYGKS